MSITKRKKKHFIQQGEVYGRLTVVELDTEKTRPGTKYFRCRCECGTIKTVRAASLTNGNTSSCGCLHLELLMEAGKLKATHGESRKFRASKLYHCYTNMIRRCYDEKTPMYIRYGARGIRVCERWRNDRTAFFDDMGQPPSKGHSIDRIDNSGGYWCRKLECAECGSAGRKPNCRWAEPALQAANKQNNRMFTHGGRTLCMAEWARESGISYKVLQQRIDSYKWSFDRAISEPIRKICRAQTKIEGR
jgi:hypothetical protein